ncbi:MAG: hypothetical protein NTY20_05120 [Candidatus Aenigmarchaeota archaeon]|nr:hypothetical protein [Candidatus Aenigmarchaeota archaeon]
MKRGGLKDFAVFLALAYLSAMIFENVPRLLFGSPFLLEVPGWPWLILGWYALIFSVAYFVFKDKKIAYPVVFGIVVGMLAEAFLFRTINIISIFLFPFLYGGMFYLPFKLSRMISKVDKKT